MAVSKFNNNKWGFDVWYYDMFGVRKRKRVRTFKTRKEALEGERHFLNSIKYDNASNITFSELCIAFLHFKKNRLKITGYVKEEQRINNHIINFFKNIKIDKLNVKIALQWQDYLQNKNLSNGYINKLTTLASSIFDFGERQYMLPKNPFKLIDKLSTMHEIKKVNFYTLEEYFKFESAIDDIVFKTFFNLLYFSGLRKGEALALNWNDLDFDTNSIEVNKAVTQKIKGVKYQIITPKNKSSYRKIELPQNTIDLLKELKNYNKQYTGFNNDTFIFGIARPINENTISNKKKKYCELANIKNIRVHDFRHSHASLLINNGENALTVANRLGHSDVKMTLNTYSHFFKEKEKETIRNIEDMVKKYKN